MQDNVVDPDRTAESMSAISLCNTPKYALDGSILVAMVEADRNREMIHVKVERKERYTAESTHKIIS